MTDKALEAALKAWFDNTVKGWSGAMQAAISAYLSALPGEAEVSGYLFSLRYGQDRWSHQLMFSDTLPKEGDAKEIEPLVTLASLQAMQARAEKAERERDEAQRWSAEIGRELSGVRRSYFDERQRAFAAEARVKELKEALEPFVPVYEPWMDKHADNVGLGFYRPATFGDLRRARTALKGGSNG